jgi:hypothetical protein
MREGVELMCKDIEEIKNSLICGDSLSVLKRIPANAVDLSDLARNSLSLFDLTVSLGGSSNVN